MYLHSLVYAFAGGIFDKYLNLMCFELRQTSAKLFCFKNFVE